jgi:hypothetical protein
MNSGQSRFARLRRRLGLRAPGAAKPEDAAPEAAAAPVDAAPVPSGAAPAPLAPPEVAPTPLAAIRRGLGERPSKPGADQAAEAELDTLRGELVRELDRMSRRAAGG